MNQRADRNFPLPYRSGCTLTASPARTTLHRHVGYWIAPIACTGAHLRLFMHCRFARGHGKRIKLRWGIDVLDTIEQTFDR
jgi:hypothetical protein